MKKTLVSALTTALVIGAAGTVFAAANPFSDVPADHWAYDAVAQLAQDGVIEGYGDATYRGQQEITRYEMAQMVARAMAKSNGGVNQALLDKLAAEFAEELNSLGVRVAALEKKVDNVIWTGRIRWRTSNLEGKGVDATGNNRSKTGRNQLLFRLEPKATVNSHWFVQTRLDYLIGDTANAASMPGPQDDAKGALQSIDRMWAQGQYGKTTIRLGKINYVSQSTYGLLMNRPMTGMDVTYGKDLKVNVYLARADMSNASGFGATGGNVGNVAGIDIYNNRKDKFTYGLGYMNISGLDKDTMKGKKYIDDDASIIHFGLGYKFSKKLGLTAAYAKNTKGELDSDERTRMNFELKYGNANKAKAGSWEVWTKYARIGNYSGFFSQNRLDNGAMVDDFKGWEFGAKVTLEKNIDAQVRYLEGKKVSNDALGYRGWFTEVNFFF